VKKASYIEAFLFYILNKGILSSSCES